MPLTLSTKIQNTVPDSIAYAEDLQLGVRANGEQKTSFIDLAGNIYNAEIPSPVNAAVFTGLTAAANGITPVGFYGYRYVYAASTRYPLVDGGKAIGGSIAPRGNPSPTSLATSVVNMNVNLNYVNLTLGVSDRKDITEIWVFRTVNYANAADALLALDAGLCFYVGKATNSPGAGTVAFQDTSPSGSLDQIEFDNFPAPTFKYVTYIPPYFWGIGNDQLIIPVEWNGKTVSITDSSLQWFDGRDGQLTTINGITTGGIDGRGTFLFKAGDTAGFNPQINCILTKDGVTAETLVPATGTGYILIQGNGSILYRSKFKNPLAWGVTQTIGSSRQATVYAISVATGNATAIAGLPEDQQLKVDFKNPPACYTYNLRLASAPEFETTRKLISNYSISAHASQFIASYQGHKVLWGWDADTFAILQCDGNSQYPISDAIYSTLREAVREPYRIQFAHGVCDDENELNCIWIPFKTCGGASPYRQSPFTDLMIYQHYPSGKWGYNYDLDLTCAVKVRDLNINKLKILGGTEQGLLMSINDGDRHYNVTSPGGIETPVTVTPTTIQYAGAAFLDPLEIVGTWGVLYTISMQILYVRLLGLIGSTLTIDLVVDPTSDYISTQILSGFFGTPANNGFVPGGIPQIIEKTFDFGKPTALKRIQNLYLKGSFLDQLITKLGNSTTRFPKSFSTDNNFLTGDIYSVIDTAVEVDMFVPVELFSASPDTIFKGLGLKMA